MANLLRKPTDTSRKCHDITVESANWRYVGFGLYKLQAGETVKELTDDLEVILVLVEGKAIVTAAGQDFGEMGERILLMPYQTLNCLDLLLQHPYQHQ